MAFNRCLTTGCVHHSVFGLFLHLHRTYLALFYVLCLCLVLHFVVLKEKIADNLIERSQRIMKFWNLVLLP